MALLSSFTIGVTNKSWVSRISLLPAAYSMPGFRASYLAVAESSFGNGVPERCRRSSPRELFAGIYGHCIILSFKIPKLVWPTVS